MKQKQSIDNNSLNKWCLLILLTSSLSSEIVQNPNKKTYQVKVSPPYKFLLKIKLNIYQFLEIHKRNISARMRNPGRGTKQVTSEIQFFSK
jgi:hypothetical protein